MIARDPATLRHCAERCEDMAHRLGKRPWAQLALFTMAVQFTQEADAAELAEAAASVPGGPGSTGEDSHGYGY